jgi:four helix bundle protein
MNEAQHPASNIQHRTSNEEGDVWEFREGGTTQRRFNLEDRLLEFASAVIDLSEDLPNTRAGNHVAGQILRSGTSPYPNHGEAEDAESRDDFVHKLKLCLKELRETHRWAHLINRKTWVKDNPTLPFVLGESEELIRIFYRSIQTARRNAQAEKHPASDPLHHPSGKPS